MEVCFQRGAEGVVFDYVICWEGMAVRSDLTFETASGALLTVAACVL